MLTLLYKCMCIYIYIHNCLSIADLFYDYAQAQAIKPLVQETATLLAEISDLVKVIANTFAKKKWISA